MEKFLVLSLMIIVGVFIAFLAVMILTRMIYDLVMVSVKIYSRAAGRKGSAKTSC